MQGARCGTRSRDPGVTSWAEGGAKPLSPRLPGPFLIKHFLSPLGTVTSQYVAPFSVAM